MCSQASRSAGELEQSSAKKHCNCLYKINSTCNRPVLNGHIWIIVCDAIDNFPAGVARNGDTSGVSNTMFSHAIISLGLMTQLWDRYVTTYL